MVRRTIGSATAVLVLLLLVLFGVWWLLRENIRRGDVPADRVPPTTSDLVSAPAAVPIGDIAAAPDGLPATAADVMPEALAPDLPGGIAARRRTISGRIVDANGKPLAGHIVRLTEVPDLKPAPEATTDAEGRFSITGVSGGAKVLRLFGPAPGDIRRLVLEQHAPSGVGLGFHLEEGRITLAVPAAGLSDLEFVGPRHAAFWVQGQVELEGAGADELLGGYAMAGIQLCADAPDWNGAMDTEDRWLLARAEARSRRPGIELQPVGDAWNSIKCSFLVGADRPSDTLLVLALPGYATQTRKVQGEAPVEQVGTIVLRRVAGLTIDLQDIVAEDDVEKTVIELRETGGGLPDRVSRHGVQASRLLFGGRTVWSERSTGHYELRITVPGYVTWTGSGDLVLPDPESGPPIVRVTLTRAP